MSRIMRMTRIKRAGLAWSVLCLIWLIYVLARVHSSAFDPNARNRVVTEVVGVWIFGLGVIAFVWFVDRGKRTEPSAVQAAIVPPAPAPSTPPAGWYTDAERPGRKRWWTGTAWGMRDDEHPSRASMDPPADAHDANGGAPQLDSEPASEVEVAAESAEPAEVAPEPAVVATAVQPVPEAEPVPAATMSSRPEPASDDQPAAHFCENCGAERRPGARFCSSCGHAH